SSRRRHTRWPRDWSSDVCSSDLPGDEVVLSRLDHDANVRPWVQVATRAGAAVRWAEVDLATGELPVEQYRALLSDRTRLVAVTRSEERRVGKECRARGDAHHHTQ